MPVPGRTERIRGTGEEMKLLQDSANNANPFEGFTPSMPSGEQVDFAPGEYLGKAGERGNGANREVWIRASGRGAERATWLQLDQSFAEAQAKAAKGLASPRISELSRGRFL